jgi:hypothetical protein
VEARFRLLARSLKFTHAGLAGGSLSVGPGFVELVTLAGMLSLSAQIIQMRV